MPELTVVAASHDRPLRLRWLLNALEEQTLDRDLWEVVIAHDSQGPETEELLRTHPLVAEGQLRHVTLPFTGAVPGANRNAGWREGRGRWIIFTDDDCRPPADWLANAWAAIQRNPDAIVQGMTQKDPDEEAILSAPYWHSQLIRPPTPWAETCNIIYPRELLERLDGFDEHNWGEDTDLALRGRALGAPYIGDAEVKTYHAVVEMTLRQLIRSRWRWQDLPLMVKRHPELRRDFPLWVFWKRTHVWAPVFVAGVALTRRHQGWSVLCVPWVVHAMPTHGTNPRGRYRNLMDLPSRLLLDGVEMAALAKGSIRHRSLFL